MVVTVYIFFFFSAISVVLSTIMEKQQWTTPVWCKNMCLLNEEKRKDVSYTYPDWGNAGPGIPPPTHHARHQHIEGDECLCLYMYSSGDPYNNALMEFGFIFFSYENLGLINEVLYDDAK